MRNCTIADLMIFIVFIAFLFSHVDPYCLCVYSALDGDQPRARHAASPAREGKPIAPLSFQL